MNKYVIIAFSVVVPLFIGALFFNVDTSTDSNWIHVLPVVNASINGINAIVLMLAVYFVKIGNERFHKLLMKMAFALGLLFMISYVTYHSSVPSTVFGDINGDGILQDIERTEIGGMRTVYIVLLLSHILMAVLALPLILTAFTYALKDNREKHRKIVRFTFPVWLYVSLTGVIVYFLISPYY